MATKSDIWKPGSFTKNFGWGTPKSGLIELHDAIRLGFRDSMEDVPRDLFQHRISVKKRPAYIPMNFFLFSKNVNGVDCLCADELVFQALNWAHSESFDKLALFSFNLSLAGFWKGASLEQRRPALWANAYITERLFGPLGWDTSKVSADDIQKFVQNDNRYKAKTSRKLATNLNYLFNIGGLKNFPTPQIERWWVDSLFLALDRIIEHRAIDKLQTNEAQYPSLLAEYDFLPLTGYVSIEKEMAIKHLTKLYWACGGRNRFSDEAVEARTKILDPQSDFFLANDPRPRGAIHPTNPRTLKSIPRACAMLAKYAGFEVISPDEFENFNLSEFILDHTERALQKLKFRNIRPILSADDLMKLTRER